MEQEGAQVTNIVTCVNIQRTTNAKVEKPRKSFSQVVWLEILLDLARRSLFQYGI